MGPRGRLLPAPSASAMARPSSRPSGSSFSRPLRPLVGRHRPTARSPEGESLTISARERRQAALDGALTACRRIWEDPRATQQPGWGLAPDAVEYLLRLVELLTPKHVVEFGSGISTHVLGRACAALSPAGAVTSLESDPHYLDEVSRALTHTTFDHQVTVLLAPLGLPRVEGRLSPVYRFARESFASMSAPEVVLVDGPPSALGGRLGSTMQAVELVHANGVVLLDDAKRPAEQAVLAAVETNSKRACSVTYLDEFSHGLGVILPAPE